MKKMKRLLAPKFWKVPKKLRKWVVSPRPSPHKKFECIPLQIIIRDILNIAETRKEAKSIIKNREVLVDGKVVKDHKYPVGLMDSIAIPKLNQYYRVIMTRRGLGLIKISKKESKLKICRINNKTIVKKGKLQLNLHDGRNILVDKDVYKTGDSVLIELPTQKILEHIKFEKGSLGLVTKGKNSGNFIKIKKITKPRFNEPTKVIFKVQRTDKSDFRAWK
jgi:small subunit ribosomal protein S4e